jgi:hypothetical protein
MKDRTSESGSQTPPTLTEDFQALHSKLADDAVDNLQTLIVTTVDRVGGVKRAAKLYECEPQNIYQLMGNSPGTCNLRIRTIVKFFAALGYKFQFHISKI